MHFNIVACRIFLTGEIRIELAMVLLYTTNIQTKLLFRDFVDVVVFLVFSAWLFFSRSFVVTLPFVVCYRVISIFSLFSEQQKNPVIFGYLLSSTCCASRYIFRFDSFVENSTIPLDVSINKYIILLALFLIWPICVGYTSHRHTLTHKVPIICGFQDFYRCSPSVCCGCFLLFIHEIQHHMSFDWENW